MARLEKLLRMSRRELGWRMGVAARTQRDRALWHLRQPAWDRTRLKVALAPDVRNPVLLTHIDRHDWSAAERTLVRAFQARPRRFVLDPKFALELRHQILKRWPGAAADASRRADQVMGRRFDLLGYRGLTFDGGDGQVDWHFDPVHRRHAPQVFWADVPYLDPAIGDHKIIWELNRNQHWLALGRALWLTRDRRYAWAIVSQLESWIAANPPLTGVNWASALELGFRSLSWVWALHFLLADTNEGAAGPAHSPWLVDLVVALDSQLTFLERNLSYYFSPNTHLTGEALALYVCGLSLPELAASGRWTALGRRILLDEIDRQIAADGGHAERSTHYHRYTLDFYLLALLMAERAQDGDAIVRFTDAATRAAEFARAIADDRGRLPLIGDDDGGALAPIAGRACDDIRDSLALAAVVLGRPDFAPWGLTEEVFWIAGRTAIDQEPFVDAHRTGARPPASRAFRDTGYVVLRDGAGAHLVFDVGPHGYMNGGHAHADALSVTLSVAGRPLLIDPGTSAYTINPALRDRLRSTASHNTLMLDGQPSSLPAGPFHWESRTDAQQSAFRSNVRFDWAEAWHDGYRGNRHRRTVFRSPAGWLFVDEVLGRGRHAAALHWHFDPAWVVTAEAPGTLCATRFGGGATAWLVHDADRTTLLHGDDESGLGWFAPVYGTLIPTWTARAARAAAAPLSIVTWIATSRSAPALTRLPVECDPGGSAAIALRVRQDGTDWITVARPGEAAARETRGCRAGDYHTDGRLLHYGACDGRLQTVVACDAHHVLALREGWLSIAADAPVPDLCVDVLDGRRLDVWSSSPPSRLRVQGAAVMDAATVRLNGRELPAYARERLDSIVAFASDWGEPGRTLPCAASPVSQI